MLFPFFLRCADTICRYPRGTNLQVLDQPGLVLVGKSLDARITGSAFGLELRDRHIVVDPRNCGKMAFGQRLVGYFGRGGG